MPLFMILMKLSFSYLAIARQLKFILAWIFAKVKWLIPIDCDRLIGKTDKETK